MILPENRPDALAECWVIACDRCGYALDPGALDAPNGGWSTQRAAYDAGEVRGWLVNPCGEDVCPECQDGPWHD